MELGVGSVRGDESVWWQERSPSEKMENFSGRVRYCRGSERSKLPRDASDGAWLGVWESAFLWSLLINILWSG
jgi:hypothetical protein